MKSRGLYSTSGNSRDDENNSILGCKCLGATLRQRGDQSQCARAVEMFLPVVWWGTLVEIHSTIRRAHLLGKLNDQEKAKALSRLQLLSRGWREILPDDTLRDLARQLLDAYDLRAADSFQLAAALVCCQHRSARRNVLTADRRLSESARAQGVSVVESERLPDPPHPFVIGSKKTGV